MSFAALRIRAAVRMEPEYTSLAAPPMMANRGVTISFRGKHFPGRVLACERPISPGESGEASIGVLASSPHDVDMQVGSQFELRDDPARIIATATVLAVEESRVLEPQGRASP